MYVANLKTIFKNGVLEARFEYLTQNKQKKFSLIFFNDGSAGQELKYLANGVKRMEMKLRV